MILSIARKDKPSSVKRSVGNGEFISIKGSLSFAIFYAVIGLGTNPYEVQLDTGSTDLLVYDSSCQTCGSAPSYTPGPTSTMLSCPSTQASCRFCTLVNGATACGFSDTYGDGNQAQGYVLTDYMTFGNVSDVQVIFGAILVTNTFSFEPSGVSGIWGLANPQTSAWGGNSAIQTIITNGNLRNCFSLCLTSTNPMMTMGYDYTTNGNFQWTPFVPNSAWYSITLTDIQAGGSSLGISASTLQSIGTILDSGTTLIALPPAIWNVYKNYLTNYCNTVQLYGYCTGTSGGRTLLDGYCYQMTQAQMQQWPSFGVSISGISTPFTLTYSQLFYATQSGGKTFQCFGLQLINGSDPIILGDVFMQNYHVVFDNTAGKAGLGPLSTCPTTANVPSTTTIIASTQAISDGNILPGTIFFTLCVFLFLLLFFSL